MQVERWKLDSGDQKIDNISMKNYKDLDVYQRSSKMFPKIYRMVRKWNFSDQRELGSQMIRSANSVHANISEGYSKTPKDFKRYIGNSIGSCDELTSHINDAYNVGLVNDDEKKQLLSEYEIIGKQLTKLKQNWK